MYIYISVYGVSPMKRKSRDDELIISSAPLNGGDESRLRKSELCANKSLSF